MLVRPGERLQADLNLTTSKSIELQQVDKTLDDLMENLQTLRMNLQQMKIDAQVKEIEFNSIRNVLNEKAGENYLLKEENKSLIEKLAKMERDKQEQLSIAQIIRKQSASSIPTTEDQNVSHSIFDFNEYFL